MLKSTHKPVTLAPLPAGWTEHKAPSGHTYYYNSSTKQSTYSRPVEQQSPAPQSAPISDPSQSFLQYQAVGPGGPSPGPSLPNPGFSRQFNGGRGNHEIDRGSREERNHPRDQRLQALDRPKSKLPIPGCEPWFLIQTKFGRRFVYNSAKNDSFWRIPEKLKDGILALDQQRIKEKADALNRAKGEAIEQNQPSAPERSESKDKVAELSHEAQDGAEDDSEYEEVEVTDDEDEENAAKRLRTDDGADEPARDEPVEFNEDDIAYQLAAMGQEYGLDPGEYDDGNMEEWEEGAEGVELTKEDASALFKDLLNDFSINPYSPWDKIVEDGKLVDDTRYTALTSMKARKDVWEDWSREKIKQLREQRAKEEKKDPRIPYMAFLQKNATPKLYWPEFKRKFKKEPEMRDTSLADKDREKWYREHINRLKLPHSTLKSDFLALLKSQPLSLLNKSTLLSNLPPPVLTDIRYISLDPSARDPLVETLISTLPPKPEEIVGDEDEESVKERKERERRQKALEDRERKVAEEKRRQKRTLEAGKGRLREEEEEVARAMNVTKKGLKDHLVSES